MCLAIDACKMTLAVCCSGRKINKAFCTISWSYFRGCEMAKGAIPNRDRLHQITLSLSLTLLSIISMCKHYSIAFSKWSDYYGLCKSTGQVEHCWLHRSTADAWQVRTAFQEMAAFVGSRGQYFSLEAIPRHLEFDADLAWSWRQDCRRVDEDKWDFTRDWTCCWEKQQE